MTSAALLLREARINANLTQAELAARAGTSQPAVARYEAGVVTPSVSTLERLLHATGRRLVLTVEDAPSTDLSGPLAEKARSVRKEILQAARRRGAVNVRVFGSVARGSAGAHSDLDILVDLEDGRTILDLIGLQQDISSILNVDVDVATVDLLKPRSRDRVLAEAVPL